MHKARNTHNTGHSLRPSKRFKFAHSSIPMKGPRRSKKVHRRGGGLRG
jgi:hypothetical protein